MSDKSFKKAIKIAIKAQEEVIALRDAKVSLNIQMGAALKIYNDAINNILKLKDKADE